jgi:hypothetical protein
MKKHFVVAGFFTLALAGCGHRIQEHSGAYYLQHPQITRKVVDFCKSHKALSHAQEHNCSVATQIAMQQSFDRPAKTPTPFMAGSCPGWPGPCRGGGGGSLNALGKALTSQN